MEFSIRDYPGDERLSQPAIDLELAGYQGPGTPSQRCD
jgi:hypothetical protein